jgi:hypothetical protein
LSIVMFRKGKKCFFLSLSDCFPICGFFQHTFFVSLRVLEVVALRCFIFRTKVCLC